MAQVNAGRVRFVSRGEYNNATQYYTFDLVNYNGSSYYAKQNTLGNLPTNATYWQIVAEQGNGISSIAKTSTSGLVDTYTITYTNGSTTTFNVNNGKGIVSITKVSSQDNIDTYRITYNDGTTFDYEIENGSVTQTQFDDLEDRVEDLERNQKTGEATGTEIDLTDAFDTRPRYLGIDATETKQETTTGRNLLPIVSKSSLTNNGVTLTSNGDGSYSLSGTATELTRIVFDLPTSVTMPNSNIYIHIRNNVLDTNINLLMGTTADPTITSPGFSSVNRIMLSSSLTNLTVAKMGVQIQSGATVNATFQPTLELTDNITDYEEFTGGQASPNPDYPQDVETMVGYRNLISSTRKQGDIIFFNGTTSYTDYIFKAGTYTLSYKDTNNATIYVKTASTSSTSLGVDKVKTFTVNEDFNVWLYRSGMTANEVSDAMLVKGTQELPYVPYGTNYMVMDDNNGDNIFDMQEYAALNNSYFSYSNNVLTLNSSDARAIANVNPKYEVKPNTTYYVVSDNPNIKTTIAQYNSNDGWIITNTVNRITTNVNTKYIRIKFNADTYPQNGTIYLSTNSNYKCKQYLIPLGNQELLNKNNYVDKIIVDETTGQSYIEKAWGKVVLDGEETFSEAELSETVYRFICNISDLNSVPYIYGGEDGYCNYYKYLMKYSGDLSNQRIYTQGNSIVIVTSVATQKDNFKIWLKDKYDSGTPVEVYYPLAEPQLIPIDNPNIKLLNGVNHITNSEGAEMTIVYVKDINTYLDSINARLEALENANQGE